MDDKSLRFEELKLQPGQRLQLDIADYSTTRDISNLIGYCAGQSIIVTTPQYNGAAIKVMPDTKVTVRFFSQTLNGAGAFRSQILHASATPYPHMHLAVPEKVFLGEVRRAVRARVNLPTSVHCTVNGGEQKLTSCITDISVLGARVERLPDGVTLEEGQEVLLVSRIAVSGVDCTVKVRSIIRNAGHGRNGAMMGVEFTEVDNTTRVLLHGYTLSQMLDFPC